MEKAKFKVGDKVMFEGEKCVVKASMHAAEGWKYQLGGSVTIGGVPGAIWVFESSLKPESLAVKISNPFRNLFKR